MTAPADLDFYLQQDEMSDPRRHAPAVAALPGDVGALTRVIQGVMLHEHFAPAYGVSLSDERRAESHLRSVAKILDGVLEHDARPLAERRGVDGRIIGVCRHFSLLLVSMLRAHGITARARCGFGAYFTPDFEDHWVGEYWNREQQRWVLVDAQIDEVQRAALSRVQFDLLDVPRDRFLLAGDAWQRCRSGELDPNRFGIFTMRGLWFVAGNLVRDFASLNGVAMLPWDVWGAMSPPDAPIGDEHLALLDRVAAITLDPDARFAELRELYRDERLRVPVTVFNAVRQSVDTVEI